jgi:hypothetical protein
MTPIEMKAAELVEIAKVDLKSGKPQCWCGVCNYNACVRKATLTKSIDLRLTCLQTETETLLNNELWSGGMEGSFFCLCVMSSS